MLLHLVVVQFISGFFHAHSPRKRAINTKSSAPPMATLYQPIQWNWSAPAVCAARVLMPAIIRKYELASTHCSIQHKCCRGLNMLLVLLHVIRTASSEKANQGTCANQKCLSSTNCTIRIHLLFQTSLFLTPVNIIHLSSCRIVGCFIIHFSLSNVHIES